MTVQRRALAELFTLDDSDLEDTLAWALAGLRVDQRRRLLDRVRKAEVRAGATARADRTPTQRRQDADSGPPPRTERRQDADATPTGRRQDADRVGSSSSLITNDLKIKEKIPARADAADADRTPTPTQPADFPAGGHPEDADYRLFATAANQAYAAVGRPVAFPAGHVSYSDQKRVRDAWPRLHAAAVAHQLAVAQYIERTLTGFLRSPRATWVLWLLDPTVGSGGMRPPAPHSAFDDADNSPEAIDRAVGAGR